MGQFYGIETIKILEIDSLTTLNWPAGSRLRIGGQSYLFETDTALDLATDIDTGSVASNTLYYVYAVFNSSTQLRYLRYSLSDAEVNGETNFRLIGFLQTNSNADIRRVQNSLDGNVPLADKAPVGSIISLGKSSVPSGYLACNGDAVSRTTYADLFAEIGTTHGEGDGSTTFNVPDLRGRFLRGLDEGVGRDPDAAARVDKDDLVVGDVVGSIQDEATKPNGMSASTTASTVGAGGHQHIGRGRTADAAYPLDGSVGLATDPGNGINASGSFGVLTRIRPTTGAYDPVGDHSHTVNASTSLSGDNETRVKNVAVKYAIKY